MRCIIMHWVQPTFIDVHQGEPMRHDLSMRVPLVNYSDDGENWVVSESI